MSSLCIVCMVCGMCLHCMGVMYCKCDVSVMEVWCRFGALLVCVYCECCVWCSCVFMVNVSVVYVWYLSVCYLHVLVLYV